MHWLRVIPVARSGRSISGCSQWQKEQAEQPSLRSGVFAMRKTLMFKRLGQVQEHEPLPGPAIMFKRLDQDASREEAQVPAIVFKRPVKEAGPSCSHSQSLPSCSNGSPMLQEMSNIPSRIQDHRVHTAHPCHSLPPTMPVDPWGRRISPTDGGAWYCIANGTLFAPEQGSSGVTPSPICC